LSYSRNHPQNTGARALAQMESARGFVTGPAPPVEGTPGFPASFFQTASAAPVSGGRKFPRRRC